MKEERRHFASITTIEIKIPIEKREINEDMVQEKNRLREIKGEWEKEGWT